MTYNTLLRARSQYGSLQEVQQCLAIYQDMRKAGYVVTKICVLVCYLSHRFNHLSPHGLITILFFRYKPNDFYLKLLIEEWCEGVIQQNKQNKGQIASDRASLGPQSLLLEKVAEHLQDSNAESLSIDIRGLTKV